MQRISHSTSITGSARAFKFDQDENEMDNWHCEQQDIRVHQVSLKIVRPNHWETMTFVFCHKIVIRPKTNPIYPFLSFAVDGLGATKSLARSTVTLFIGKVIVYQFSITSSSTLTSHLFDDASAGNDNLMPNTKRYDGKKNATRGETPDRICICHPFS